MLVRCSSLLQQFNIELQAITLFTRANENYLRRIFSWLIIEQLKMLQLLQQLHHGIAINIQEACNLVLVDGYKFFEDAGVSAEQHANDGLIFLVLHFKAIKYLFVNDHHGTARQKDGIGSGDVTFRSEERRVGK